jgi:hypothetical protein
MTRPVWDEKMKPYSLFKLEAVRPLQGTRA